MPRRRRKSSLLQSLLLWSIALTLVGWGLWQAEQLRRTVLAESATTITTTQPLLAVNAATVTAQGAHGGEPWSMPPTTEPSPEIQSLDLLDGETLALPTSDGDPDQSFLQTSPALDPTLSAATLFQQGKDLLDQGQIVAGRLALNTALARSDDETLSQELRSILTSLNAPVFMGTAVLPDDPAARFVDIQSGDTFLSLGRTYGTPAAYLQLINPTLNPNNLKLLTGIKIVQGPFHARIFKHAGRLDLYAREIYVASCPVDFPDGNSLPKGDYQISTGTKLQLGSRIWIGFEGRQPATEEVSSGWLFASAGPRGTSPKDRATGIHLADSDLQQLYNVLAEGRSHLRVEP